MHCIWDLLWHCIEAKKGSMRDDPEIRLLNETARSYVHNIDYGWQEYIACKATLFGFQP